MYTLMTRVENTRKEAPRQHNLRSLGGQGTCQGYPRARRRIIEAPKVARAEMDKEEKRFVRAVRGHQTPSGPKKRRHRTKKEGLGKGPAVRISSTKREAQHPTIQNIHGRGSPSTGGPQEILWENRSDNPARMGERSSKIVQR